jgi:hypothetical protein
LIVPIDDRRSVPPAPMLIVGSTSPSSMGGVPGSSFSAVDERVRHDVDDSGCTVVERGDIIGRRLTVCTL